MSEVDEELIKIGKYLKSLRKKKGLTLVKLEEESEVSNSYLSQIENGKFRPSSDVVKKISKPLGVSYLELMYRVGHIPKKLYEEQKKAEERIKTNEMVLSHRHKELTNLEMDIKELEHKIAALKSVGAERLLIEEIEKNLISKKQMYTVTNENIQRTQHEIASLTQKINIYIESIEEWEKDFNAGEVEGIEVKLDASTKELIKFLKEETRKNFINNFGVTLSVVGFRLSEKENGKFELSKVGDTENSIIINWEELYSLGKEIFDYSKYKVEKFYDNLNDDEHKLTEGDIHFHLDDDE